MARIKFGVSLLIFHLLTVTAGEGSFSSEESFDGYVVRGPSLPGADSSEEEEVDQAARLSESCARTGGQCLRVGECPLGKAHPKKGLCPHQPGFECCYGVSTKETNCRRRGGECSDGYCHDVLVDHLGACPSKHVCCILVREPTPQPPPGPPGFP